MKDDRFLSFQIEVLKSLKNDALLGQLIDLAELVILNPEAAEIYSNFRRFKDLFRLYEGDLYNRSLETANSFFYNRDELYLLYNCVIPHLNKIGLADEAFPIFKIKKKHLKEWLKLLKCKNYRDLFLSSIDGTKILNISFLDDETGTPFYNFSVKDE